METFMGRNRKLGLKLAVSLALLAPLYVLNAATRSLPPPPARHTGDTAIDGVQQESTWGTFPESDRWQAMRDDEGEEIDFRRGTAYRVRSADRAPAGLEVTKDKRKAAVADEGWKSTPVYQERQITESATNSTGARPVLRREARTESVIEAPSERFASEINDPVARRKGVQEVSIIAGDLGFFPKTIFVSRDVPVRLFVTGASKGSLCIMMDTFNVRKQVHSNKIEEITFIPSQPGVFRFYCPVNGSEGTLVVKELTTATPGES